MVTAGVDAGHRWAGQARQGEVYRRLLDGWSQAHVARRLDLDPQRISETVATLVRQGALVQDGERSYPILYRRGPRFAAFEARLRTPGKRERRGRSRQVVGRVHRQGFRMSLRPRPTLDMKWTHQWEASKVQFYETDYEWDGRSYLIRESRGRHNRSLRIDCPEEFVTDARERAALERLQLARVASLVRHLETEFGYQAVGPLEPMQRSEEAFRTDGISPFGRPGIDPVHADRSPGYVETETPEKELGQALRSLPAFIANVEDRLQGLEANPNLPPLERLTHAVERLTAVLDKAASVHGHPLLTTVRGDSGDKSQTLGADP